MPVLRKYGKKEEENVSSSREQKKLQKTGNSGWLVCAAILDCSHLLLIVAIGIALAMQGSPHNAMHSSSSLGIDDSSFKCLNIWLSCFKQRRGIASRKLHGEATSVGLSPDNPPTSLIQHNSGTLNCSGL